MKKAIPINTIGIAFNLKGNDAVEDQHEEYDDIETIESLKAELERYGFKVVLLEQNDAFLQNLSKYKPDFVLNIAEGVGNTRARESQVPCLLENLGIPYSGSDPITLGITLDKYLTNLILKAAQIPVPLMFMIKDVKEIDGMKNIFKEINTYIVKPRWEGSSKGIFSNSVVYNLKELEERVLYIISKYQQPAVVEEFLEKEEITTGLCGNGKSAHILGMMKIVPRDGHQDKFLYSLENKREWRSKIKYEPQEAISPSIQYLVKEGALAAYHILELKDCARVDFRVSKDNIPKIIDVNPLPGLSPIYSDLPILYKLKGKKYSDLVGKILEESFRRYGFEWKYEE